MAEHDSIARNTSPQLDAAEIANEAREIARESLASLFGMPTPPPALNEEVRNDG